MWILGVGLPHQWICDDVFLDALQGLFVANDVLVVAPLPELVLEWLPREMLHSVNVRKRGERFESSHDIGQNRAFSSCSGFRVGAGAHKGRPYEIVACVAGYQVSM